MVNILDGKEERDKLNSLINEAIPKKKIGYSICKTTAAPVMLPVIDVGTKFLMQLGNVEDADVQMKNSCFSFENKLFWQLHVEWNKLGKQKRFTFDVLPNQEWLTFLSNTRTLGLTSNDSSKVVSISDVTTDALEKVLFFAQIFRRNLKADY